ncbi:hypothetical protein TNCT_109381 [Trichonephila clavata]|uniref:Uncharacterized protein n=1 Tax=Trichonephila clavata TaxID=2740835 RepID=A0A8X6L229_TRICU|nr:hypothetical protein TNCT_109381 [Trichonephila clavata]
MDFMYVVANGNEVDDHVMNWIGRCGFFFSITLPKLVMDYIKNMIYQNYIECNDDLVIGLLVVAGNAHDILGIFTNSLPLRILYHG